MAVKKANGPLLQPFNPTNIGLRNRLAALFSLSPMQSMSKQAMRKGDRICLAI
jgi:hypothetical protein